MFYHILTVETTEAIKDGLGSICGQNLTVLPLDSISKIALDFMTSF